LTKFWSIPVFLFLTILVLFIFHFFSIFSTCGGRKSRKTATCDGSDGCVASRYVSSCGRRKWKFWGQMNEKQISRNLVVTLWCTAARG
jgi:hypothetical protein